MPVNSKDGWRKVEMSPTWDYKNDKEIQGVYLSKKEDVGPNNSMLYSIRKEDGSVIGVWGNKILDDIFPGIDFGEEVYIEYLGLQKTQQGNREYHVFEVSHRKPTFKKAEPAASTEGGDLPF